MISDLILGICWVFLYKEWKGNGMKNLRKCSNRTVRCFCNKCLIKVEKYIWLDQLAHLLVLKSCHQGRGHFQKSVVSIF